MSAESNPDITKTALTDRRYKTSPMVAPVTKIFREANDHEKQTSLSTFVRRLRGWTTLDALGDANFRAAQSARAASGSKPGPTREAESSSTDPAEPCATNSAKPCAAS